MARNLKTTVVSIVWIQITAGQGPRECAWVVAKLSNTIAHAAAGADMKVEWIETAAFDNELRKQDLISLDTYRSVVLRIEGEGTEAFAQNWHGSILWHGESPYRPRHKRRNWFVGVNTFLPPSMAEPDEALLMAQLKIETMRASGPGGQHTNKTDSAVRVTHLPTGIQVRMSSERSQHRNRQLALEHLRMLLNQQQEQELERQQHARWLKHYDIKRGAPRRTFYGLEFKEK